MLLAGKLFKSYIVRRGTRCEDSVIIADNIIFRLIIIFVILLVLFCASADAVVIAAI